MPRKTEIVEMPDTLARSEATENVNKVPKRQWRKWNNQSRFIFNYVYSSTEYQTAMKHPAAPFIPIEQWKTIRWNAAWLAAEAAWHSIKPV